MLTYSGLTVFDADGARLTARFELVAEGLLLTVDERGARYPLTIDPLAQQAYLKASNTGSGDRFGDSVSVWDDTVVVGASQEDSAATGVNGDPSSNGASNAGAAYVFVRTGTSWSPQVYLKASNTNGFDDFGRFVAVSGDTVAVSGNTAVVGASSFTEGEDSNATDGEARSISTHIYMRSCSTGSTRRRPLARGRPGTRASLPQKKRSRAFAVPFGIASFAACGNEACSTIRKRVTKCRLSSRSCPRRRSKEGPRSAPMPAPRPSAWAWRHPTTDPATELLSAPTSTAFPSTPLYGFRPGKPNASSISPGTSLADRYRVSASRSRAKATSSSAFAGPGGTEPPAWCSNPSSSSSDSPP